MVTRRINPTQAGVLRVLIKSNRWMNTTEIAGRATVSWNTAAKYLLRMHHNGWIAKKGNYWRARIK